MEGWGNNNKLGYAQIIAMTMACGGLIDGNPFSPYEHSVKRDMLKDIDIEKEYHLIQKKKSRLSSRLRDSVVYRYERNRGE